MVGPEISEQSRAGTAAAEYWSQHHVDAPDGGFASEEHSLAHYAWRNSIYLGYLESMPVSDADGKVIVDFGCGPGNDLVGFGHFSRPARLIGIDVSRQVLSLAERRLALHRIQAELICTGQTCGLPLDSGSVDLVHCSGVLMHLPNPEKALAEFRRILRRDGYAQVMVYHYDSLWMHLYVAYVKMLAEARYAGLTKQEAFTRSTDGEDCPISTAYRFEEFAELAAAAGLRCEFAGVSISTLEMQLLPQRFAALEDKRLDSESRECLYELRFSDRGLPTYRGRVAGINLACRLYPC
jgi:SAM-dependent methyltransferase